jgi:hypothetical protein
MRVWLIMVSISDLILFGYGELSHVDVWFIFLPFPVDVLCGDLVMFVCLLLLGFSLFLYWVSFALSSVLGI